MEKVEYYTSLNGTNIALQNLKKINNKLDENNVVTLAFLANNPYLDNEDREKYSNKLKEIALKEYEIYSNFLKSINIKDNELCRNENSSTNESECNN